MALIVLCNRVRIFILITCDMKIKTGRGFISLVALIGIWSISAIINLPGLAVSPILGKLSTVFPKATELDIQMLTSLPSLLIIPFIIFSGKLTEKVNYMIILRIGLIIFSACGILYLLAQTMWQLIAISALLGVGAGLLIPLSTGLVSKFFVGKYRVKQFGLTSAISNLSLVAMTALAGFLAEKSWHLPFIVYLFPIISIFLTFFLDKYEKTLNPNDTLGSETVGPKSSNSMAKPVTDKTDTMGTQSTKQDDKINTDIKQTTVNKTSTSTSTVVSQNIPPLNKGKSGIQYKFLFQLMGFYLLTTFLVIIIDLNIPFIIKDDGLRSGSTGVMISLFFLAIMLPGFFINNIVNFLKKETNFYSLVVISGGFLLVAFVRNEILVAIGCILIGLGYGVIQPIIYEKTASIATPDKATFALSLVMTMNYLAVFLPPFVYNFIRHITHNPSQELPFIISAVVTIILCIWVFLKRKAFVFGDIMSE